jgi:hypothetical protein
VPLTGRDATEDFQASEEESRIFPGRQCRT